MPLGITSSSVFHALPYAPRRVEPFMGLYEGAPSVAGVEYMEMFTDAGYTIAPWDSGIPLTGDLEIRLDLAADDWIPDTNILNTFMAHGFTNLSDFRWYVGIGQDARLLANTRGVGGNTRSYESSVLTWPDARYQLRFTLNRNDGVNSVGTWYRRSPTLGLEEDTGWAVVGQHFLSTLTDLRNVQAPLVTMANFFEPSVVGAEGKLYRFLLYDGISGPIVADLNFDNATPTETEVWDDQAQLRLWSMQGSEGIDWLHSTTTLVSSQGGVLQLEGGVSVLALDPVAMQSAGGELQLEGGVSTRFFQQAISLLVDGTQQSIVVGSLSITNAINGRSTMEVTIADHGATKQFQFNQPISVIGLDGRTPLFEGWIDSVEEESWLTKAGVSVGLYHRITAKDHHYLADKRIVFADYSAQTAGSIVTHLIETLLSQEGIVAGTIEDGATIETTFSREGETAAEVIQSLADMSDYVWTIGPGRVLDFRPKTSVTASVVSYGTGMLRGTVRVRRTNQNYRNREFVVGGPALPTGPQTKTVTFTGDGVKRLFSLPYYPSTSDTSVFSIRVNGVDKTFKRINGSVGAPPVTDGTRQWYYSQIRRELVQDPSQPVLGPTDTVEIRYVTLLIYRQQRFISDGVARTYNMASPYYAVNVSAVHMYVDYGLGYAHELISPMTSTGTESWTWTLGSKVLNRKLGGATVPAGATIVAIYGDATLGPVSESERSDEITRNQAIEGGTTSGIVEAVVSRHSAASAEEGLQVAQGDLNRWSHDTVEVEFQTWNSQLTDGEIATIDLPDHGITLDDFLVRSVTITDTGSPVGTADTKSSPLRYTVQASIGAMSPRSFAELLRDINEPVRLT